MNILLIGSGGREHALAWAHRRQPAVDKLYCAPGNPGIDQIARIVVARYFGPCRRHRLLQGQDHRLRRGRPRGAAGGGASPTISSRPGSRCSGHRNSRPSLKARRASPRISAPNTISRPPPMAASPTKTRRCAYLEDHRRADRHQGGWAGGGQRRHRGDEDGRGARPRSTTSSRASFGGAECVIEEFLEGEEASFFVLSDGTHALPLATAQDHKRVGEGDTGPNTGGMGAYSPAPCMTQALCAEALEKIVKPTIRALSDMGHPYVGVLYAGLILTSDGPKLIEYNVPLRRSRNPGADAAAEGRYRSR